MSWKALTSFAIAAIGLGGSGLVLLHRGAVRFNYPSVEQYPIQGVDVSHHQGKIDWSLLKGPWAQFAYIKASEGATFRDPAFRDNWAGARSAGVVAGAYHFFTLCKPGIEQAANFLAVLPEPSEPTLPPAVDLEFGGNCAERPSPAAFRQELQNFLTAVETWRGCRLVLYVTQEFHAQYVDGYFRDNPLWVRDIFKRPVLRSGVEWRLWQYANRGRLPGVSTFIDLNVFNGTASEFAAFRCGGRPRQGAELSLIPVRP
jgi:lysozyme